ncbi:PucR family transcriptional regulator [Nonomuraea lactucae]|uniref:PucR family transcriptional regulator n=1 Tax=Nonomuraea lactucae TaxID=2249762 RepID=UPI000DE28C80|nr:helix-turn-helix domain-containing protein [Nonomuraea lactucae]
MTDAPDDGDVLEAVIAAMLDRHEQARDRILDDLIEQAPSYRHVPRELLEQIWARHIDRTLGLLRHGRVPSPEEIDEAEVASDRVARGVQLADGLSAFRRAYSTIRDMFIAEATRHGLDPALIIDRTTGLWELTDVESRQIAAVHRRAEMSAALYDARRRADFLHGLLHGTLSAAEIHGGAATYGLDTSRTYQAIRASAATEANTEPGTGAGTGASAGASAKGGTDSGTGARRDQRDQVARRLEDLCRSHGRIAMIGVDDGTIAGIVQAKPDIGDLRVTAGLGPPAALGDVHRSYRTAGRLLGVARAYGRTGVHDLGDLSWRIAVASERELSELLVDRHLRPLAAEGEFGALIEQSLRAYLDTGGQIGVVARRLHVHVNTVRYRLRRYEELTGARLDSPDTTVELSWALAARDLPSASLD